MIEKKEEKENLRQMPESVLFSYAFQKDVLS